MDIVEGAENTETALTAFFKTNELSGSVGNIAQSLTYPEFPQHFILKPNENNLHSKM